MKLATLLLAQLLSLSVLFSQNYTFSELDTKSRLIDAVPLDSSLIETLHDEELLITVYVKQYWLPEDLPYFDLAFNRIKETNNLAMIAFASFCGGEAYLSYDPDISDSLLRKAYFMFRTLKDVDGQIRCLNLIDVETNPLFNSDKKEHFSSILEELTFLVKKTDYIPSKLSVLNYQLSIGSLYGRNIQERDLDSIQIYLNALAADFSDGVGIALSYIGIAYHQLGFPDKSLKCARQSIRLLSPEREDYFNLAHNLAVTFLKINLDSALFYEKIVFQALPEPNSIWQYQIRQFSAHTLGIIWYKKGVLDSSQYYMNLAVRYAMSTANFMTNQKAIYADKAFQTQRIKADLASKEAALTRSRLQSAILLAVILIGSILAVALTLLYRQQKRLATERNAIAKQREKLLRVISHDLGAPLQLFQQSASIFPYLIEEKRFADLLLGQESLLATSITLQKTLENLYYWSLGAQEKNASAMKTTAVDVRALLKDVTATYSNIAQANKQEIILSDITELTLESDLLLLAQLFRNLVYNAIKHGQTNSEIKVSLHKKENSFTLNVVNATTAEKAAMAAQIIAEATSTKPYRVTAQMGLGMELIMDALNKLEGTITTSYTESQISISVQLAS